MLDRTWVLIIHRLDDVLAFFHLKRFLFVGLTSVYLIFYTLKQNKLYELHIIPVITNFSCPYLIKPYELIGIIQASSNSICRYMMDIDVFVHMKICTRYICDNNFWYFAPKFLMYASFFSLMFTIHHFDHQLHCTFYIHPVIISTHVNWNNESFLRS